MFKLRWLGLKNLKFACMFFRVRKNMHTRRVRCYFVNAKIAHCVYVIHVCYGSVYECAQLILDIEYIYFVFIYFFFYKMLLDSFCQFVNNLYYVLKHFVDTQILLFIC